MIAVLTMWNCLLNRHKMFPLGGLSLQSFQSVPKSNRFGGIQIHPWIVFMKTETENKKHASIKPEENTGTSQKDNRNLDSILY